jgi:hypothetical protein
MPSHAISHMPSSPAMCGIACVRTLRRSSQGMSEGDRRSWQHRCSQARAHTTRCCDATYDPIANGYPKPGSRRSRAPTKMPVSAATSTGACPNCSIRSSPPAWPSHSTRRARDGLLAGARRERGLHRRRLQQRRWAAAGQRRRDRHIAQAPDLPAAATPVMSRGPGSPAPTTRRTRTGNAVRVRLCSSASSNWNCEQVSKLYFPKKGNSLHLLLTRQTPLRRFAQAASD